MAEATAGVVQETQAQPARSPMLIALRRLLRKKLAIAALVVIGVFYFAGLFAPVLAPYDYQTQELENKEQGPSLEHPLGTDSLGRDMLSRAIFAARTTVIVTVATVLTGGLVLAVGLGMLAGYRGGKTDTGIMRLGEFLGALPGLLMLILLNASLGPRVDNAVDWLESHSSFDVLGDAIETRSGPEFLFVVLLGLLALVGVAGLVAWLIAGEGRRSGAWLVPGVLAAVVIVLLWALQGLYATGGAADYFLVFGALSLFGWVGGARVIRSQVFALRETEYVVAARAMGASTWRIIGSHLLPNVSPIIIVGISAGLGAIVGSEIALTWFGVGVTDPTPSFGIMISDAGGQRSINAHPHLLLVPAVIIGMIIFAFNLLGDALNDVLTPRAR
jgi:ABC-type dipeptide/oligopeptide/nickel transport system permease subunit